MTSYIQFPRYCLFLIPDKKFINDFDVFCDQNLIENSLLDKSTYGFHSTVKAPFYLSHLYSEEFLLDEPSLGLAPIIVKQIFDTIKRINKENNTTILLVEQNAFGALKLSDRGYVLVNGKVTISGNSKELLENPEIKKAYLEGA